jgi:hypothetical protein
VAEAAARFALQDPAAERERRVVQRRERGSSGRVAVPARDALRMVVSVLAQNIGSYRLGITKRIGSASTAARTISARSCFERSSVLVLKSPPISTGRPGKSRSIASRRTRVCARRSPGSVWLS